jgi:hypothetical protein
MELCPQLQHGLDENVKLVGALVLCSVDPSVVPIAVVQAAQDHLLWLVDGGQVPGEVLPRHSVVCVLVELQAEAVLPDTLASLLLGVCLLFLGGFLSSSTTTTLWVSLLAISIAVFSEMSLDVKATHKVFSWALFPPVTMLFIATISTVVWRHNNLV